jgi:hypothetical protein
MHPPQCFCSRVPKEVDKSSMLTNDGRLKTVAIQTDYISFKKNKTETAKYEQ